MIAAKQSLFLLALLCTVATTGVAQTSIDCTDGSGTVQYALGQPDGVRVSLAMVVVGAVHASGVTAHEWWDKTDTVTALFDPAIGPKAGQTIDLEGRMVTLPGGERAVLCNRIAFYLDSYGSVLDAVPPIKGLLDPSVWPSKGWVSVSPAQLGMDSTSFHGIATALEDPGPPIAGTTSSGGGPTLIPGTISWAKTQTSVSLSGKIVTAATGHIATNCIYIEEPDRSAGIRVNTSSTFVIGEAVNVSGTLATIDGERVIQASSVASLGMATSIEPSGITNRDLGGGDFEYDPQTGVGQQGMHDARCVGSKTIGLNNIGLLVRTRGKVTHAESGCIYIDDGSAANDGSGHIGVRVEALGKTLLPPLDAVAEITGISSCRILNGHVVRVLRVRTQDDSPVVIRVRPGGNDANDGSTWQRAKASVQRALDVASAGMEVWVAAGAYGEHIELKAGVRLYGGFAGNETRRSERNPPANPTELGGGGAQPVVNCQPGLNAGTVIDGFVIHGGANEGIACWNSGPTIGNNTIADNAGGGICCYESRPVITKNTITGNGEAGIYCEGGSRIAIAGNKIAGNQSFGVYCHSSMANITGNCITDNTYAGVQCDFQSRPTIANNFVSGNGGGVVCSFCTPTITNNSVVGNRGYGIACSDFSPVVANNIVAFNESGIIMSFLFDPPILKHNCVYGNVSSDYSGVSDPTGTDGNISDDPILVDYAKGNLHIQPNSPCIHAGWDDAPGVQIIDIDGQARIQNGSVDIGADESDGCEWYYVTLSMDGEYGLRGQAVTLTVSVRDRSGESVEGVTVCLKASGANIVDTTGYLLPSGSIGACGDTDAHGIVTVLVTRESPGLAMVTAQANRSCGTGQTTDSMEIEFRDPDSPPVHLLFLIDVTGSTGNGTSIATGVIGTVSYLRQQLRTQGRTLLVSGAKYADGYSIPDAEVCGSAAERFRHPTTGETFTTDVDAFNAWVGRGGPGGGAESTLDILMCATDMVPDACPGLYIALGTDEDSDVHSWTPSRSDVAVTLAQSGSMVFIDPGQLYDPVTGTNLVDYYRELAVNGGAVEAASMSTFTFPTMRQAILRVR